MSCATVSIVWNQKPPAQLTVPECFVRAHRAHLHCMPCGHRSSDVGRTVPRWHHPTGASVMSDQFCGRCLAASSCAFFSVVSSVTRADVSIARLKAASILAIAASGPPPPPAPPPPPRAAAPGMFSAMLHLLLFARAVRSAWADSGSHLTPTPARAAKAEIPPAQSLLSGERRAGSWGRMAAISWSTLRLHWAKQDQLCDHESSFVI